MIIAWDNETLSNNSNSFDRMNENRLTNYIRKSIEDHLESYLGEPNDKQTRKSIESSFQIFLHNRVIHNYRVICDKTNNSPDSIDRGEINVDIIFRHLSSNQSTHLSTTFNPDKGKYKVNLPKELFKIE